MGAKGWYEGRRFRKKLESKAPNVLGGFCEASHLKRKDSLLESSTEELEN